MGRVCQEATCSSTPNPLVTSASAGAVASSVVKQKLAEVILKKQQAALERTAHTNSPSIPYRWLPVPTCPLGPSHIPSFLCVTW